MKMRNSGFKPISVDLEILKRYDKPGPRYTSYPTAPHFTNEFGSRDFNLEIEKSNQAENSPDLSLYFHLPFCERLCYFCGCTMVITHSSGRIDQYIDFLIKEIEIVANKIQPGRKVAQLHWGGGTPTYLDEKQIHRLFTAIRSNFTFHDDAEIGVEIDPRALNEERLDALKNVGFNRASMGVQDFEPKVQATINRIQSEELTRWAVDGLRDRGFESINLDLIYGLPFQTSETFEKTLDRIIKIAPDRLAVFNYAHVPWMKKHQRVIKEEDLPTPYEKLNILKLTIEKLWSANYIYIGMDHFARPDDSLAQAFYEKKLYRNFQGYSTHSHCDLYAFGMSSISQIGSVYAQSFKTLPKYYEAITDKRLPTERGYHLNNDDHLRWYVITKLMCDFELNKNQVEEKFQIDFSAYFSEALSRLKPMVADGLVELQNGSIKVTEMGQLLIRNIAMAFDKYMVDKKKQDSPMYSRTV